MLQGTRAWDSMVGHRYRTYSLCNFRDFMCIMNFINTVLWRSSFVVISFSRVVC
jgi:hypothetical protein